MTTERDSPTFSGLRAGEHTAPRSVPMPRDDDTVVPFHPVNAADLSPIAPRSFPVRDRREASAPGVARPATGRGDEPRAGRFRAWMLVPPVDLLLLLTPVLWNPEQWKAVVSGALLAVLLLTGGGRYRARLHLSVLDELPYILGRILAASAVVGTIIAFRHELDDVTVYLVNAAVSWALVVAGRFVTTAVIRAARKRAAVAHRTIVVGGGPVAQELVGILDRYPAYGLAVLGFVDDSERPPADSQVPHLGRVDDLEFVVRTTEADVLLVADGAVDETTLLDRVRRDACVECDLLVVPRLHHFHNQTGLTDHIGSIPIVRIRNPSLRGPARLAKRVFDVVVSGGFLILLAPLLAVSALAVRLEGGPGVIFRQDRVGEDGKIFQCLKLRSMRPATPGESASRWNVANDPRVGPVGRFLRRTSIDEVPQLWNIVRGDMTLVGPRPERPHFVDQFSAEFPRYRERHRVRSGLTGLAQVSGLRGDTSIADRARFDNYYIENWSLWLDTKILIRTITEVVLARGR